MKREPQLWRKNRDGKPYGCWWVTVNRIDVNLNTKSAVIARGRLPEALAGKKKGWPSDAELAAQATDVAPAPAGAPAPGPAGAPQSSAGAPAPAAAAAAVPDLVIPPSNGTTPPPAPTPAPAAPLALPPTPQGAADQEQSARAEADATNAAAAETAGKSANDNAGDAEPGPAAFALGADAIRGMLAQGASAIVELQLGLQAWLVWKRTGKIAPPVHPDSPIRKWAADAWVAQFEAWFPNMDTVPPWILAVGLPAMALPVQFVGAQPPPPDQQQNRPGTSGAANAPPTETPIVQPTEQAAA